MTESTALPADPLQQVRIVLIHSTHPGNIGAAARAMANMELGQLVLVKPRKYPHPEANDRAKGGLGVLANAQVVETLDEAIGDCKVVVGTSARARRVPSPVVNARQAAETLISGIGQGLAPVAVLFGREDRGLTNEELERCQWQLTITSSDEYSSLNLAMAVQLIGYELLMAAQAGLDDTADDETEWPSQADLQHWQQHLDQVLQGLDFYDEQNPGQVPLRMRKLFARLHPNRHELGMLRGFLSAIERYSRPE